MSFEVNPAWSEEDSGPEISDLSDEELFALMEADVRRTGVNCADEFAPLAEMAVCDNLFWMGCIPSHLYPNPCT